MFDDAEGDDDDQANGCLFGSKFDIFTHDTGGRCNVGFGVLVRKGKLPYQDSKLSKKKAHSEPTPFSDLSFRWTGATVKRVCGVVPRGGRRGGGFTGVWN